jgi:hypothetical protein
MRFRKVSLILTVLIMAMLVFSTAVFAPGNAPEDAGNSAEAGNQGQTDEVVDEDLDNSDDGSSKGNSQGTDSPRGLSVALSKVTNENALAKIQGNIDRFEENYAERLAEFEDIELESIDEETGEVTFIAKEKVKYFGLINGKATKRFNVNAEGALLEHAPWYSFLYADVDSSESDESEEEEESEVEELDEEIDKEDTETDESEILEEEQSEETDLEDLEDEVDEEQKVELDENLVAYWDFDEDLIDLASGFEGTLHGGAEFMEIESRKALYLDGVDDYVEFSEDALKSIGELSEGTISFWFNYESILNQQTVMPIFYMGNAHEDPDNMFVIEIGHSAGDGRSDDPDPNDQKIYVTWIRDNREPFLCFDSGNNMPENTWNHYVVTVGEDGNHGYVNGVLMENTDHNFGDDNDQAFLDSIENKELFLLGYGRSSFMISPEFVYYKGFIDEMRIYNRALDWSEVQELYQMQ